MRVVLSEAAHAEQAVKRAGQLMAVNQTELAHSKGQVAVGVGLKLIDEHSAGAVHRLYRKVGVVYNGGVHILLVVIPMAAALPERTVEHHGSGYLDIAVALMNLAPVVDKGISENHAVGQEEREAGALIHNGEQSELLAELSVVALLRLLEHGEVVVKILFLRESGSVNSLEHLIVRVAAPISAGAGGQLESLDARGVGDMRSRAELVKLALTEERDLLALARVLLDKLDLIYLALLLHQFDSLFGVKLISFERQSLLDYLLHLRLDFPENLGGERHIDVEIVIEAVVNGGAYRKLRLGIEALDRLSENVGGGVSERTLSVVIVKGEYFELAVLVNWGAQVFNLAVYAADARRLIESHTEALRHLHGGYAVVKLLYDSALEFNVYHKNFSFLLRAKARLRDEKSSTPVKFTGVKRMLHGSTRFAAHAATHATLTRSYVAAYPLGASVRTRQR